MCSTTSTQWIRVPKSGTGASFKTISEALCGSVDSEDDIVNRRDASSNDKYSFREVETFADGHAIIHSMAREYMGTDYDLVSSSVD